MSKQRRVRTGDVIVVLCLLEVIFNGELIHTTSITLKRRRTDVKTTSCAYWGCYSCICLLEVIFNGELNKKDCVHIDQTKYPAHITRLSRSL